MNNCFSLSGGGNNDHHEDRHVGRRVVAVLAAQPSEEVFAACNATVNGRPMSAELCALATRVYGSVVPGHYWVDDQGLGARGLTAMDKANL